MQHRCIQDMQSNQIGNINVMKFYSVESSWVTSAKRGGQKPHLPTPPQHKHIHIHTRTHASTLSLTCNSVAGSELYAGMQAVVNAPHYTERERERGQSHRIEADSHTRPDLHTPILVHKSETVALEDDMPQSHKSRGIWHMLVGLTLD